MKSFSFLALTIVVGSWILSFSPEAFAVLPSQPDVELGEILDNDAPMDQKMMKIFGWFITIIGAFIIIGILAVVAFTAVGDLNKVRDDKEYKNFTMTDFIRNAVLGVVAMLISIPIGYLLFNYGTSLTNS
ncbi:MAG: hypothetical protein HUJ13_03720 [Hydrogenovibrio crunogenus]|nr:hypothetical protein [Hydrogenovibrio crunogenus]